MTQRSYGQFCAAAKALDVVGERWTLLVVRELLLGPRRFTDLLAALPGLGTSLLTSRLKHLEAAGVIRREQLPPPAGSRVYQITDTGLGVGLVVKALADWGAQLGGGLLRRRGPGHQPVTGRRSGMPHSRATGTSARRYVVARGLRPRQAGGGNPSAEQSDLEVSTT